MFCRLWISVETMSATRVPSRWPRYAHELRFFVRDGPRSLSFPRRFQALSKYPITQEEIINRKKLYQEFSKKEEEVSFFFLPRFRLW